MIVVTGAVGEYHKKTILMQNLLYFEGIGIYYATTCKFEISCYEEGEAIVVEVEEGEGEEGENSANRLLLLYF
jgi:hypothetical protein